MLEHRTVLARMPALHVAICTQQALPHVPVRLHHPREQCAKLPDKDPGSTQVSSGAPALLAPNPLLRNIFSHQLSDRHLSQWEGKSARENPTVYMQRCSAFHEMTHSLHSIR